MNKAFIIAFFCIGSLWAQDKATTLLNAVSAQMAAQENISLTFSYSLFSAEANINQQTNGTVYIKGDRYHFNYLGIIQINDTKNTYTIAPENEEVTIVPNSEMADEMNPAKVLSFYKEGYRYSWDILQNVGGRKIQYIKLYPIDSNSDIEYLLLGIDTQTKEVYKVIETGSNGTKTTITITQYQTNTPLDPNLFSFDEAKYTQMGYYIIKA